MDPLRVVVCEACSKPVADTGVRSGKFCGCKRSPESVLEREARARGLYVRASCFPFIGRRGYRRAA